MSKPILQLQNGANWQSIWSTSVATLSDPNKPGYTYPIPPIICPILLETNIIAIYARSETGNPSWQIAGNIAKKISTGITLPGGSPDASISDLRLLRLNQINLFRFQRLTDTYALEIRPKWWIRDLSLDLFIYTGVDSDTTTEQLNRIEFAVDEIRI
jgi:hypothetical protein